MSIEKLLSERVDEVFSNTKYRDFANEYLDILHGNWRVATDKQNRSLFAIIFLVFAFELLTRAVISEVSIGPFKLTDLSIIHKLLPALIGYCYFEYLAWGRERNEIGEAYFEIINTCYPSIVENKLQYYLSPEGINIFGYQNRKLENKFMRTLQTIIRLPIILVAVISPLVVGFYAFYQLINLFGSSDFLIWFSLVSYILISILAYTSIGEHSR